MKTLLAIHSSRVPSHILNDPYLELGAYKKFKPELQFTSVPGFGKVEHQFLVEGSGPITVSYESRHAGKLTKTAELK